PHPAARRGDDDHRHHARAAEAAAFVLALSEAPAEPASDLRDHRRRLGDRPDPRSQRAPGTLRSGHLLPRPGTGHQRRRQHRQHDPRRIPCPRHPGRADRARYGRHRHRGRDVDGQGQFIDPPAENIPEPPRPPWVSIRPKGTTAYRAGHEAWPNVIPLHLTIKVFGPLLALSSLVIFWPGHHSPGGGFIAALVGSAVIGLAYLSTARDRAIGPPRAPLYLIGS